MLTPWIVITLFLVTKLKQVIVEIHQILQIRLDFHTTLLTWSKIEQQNKFKQFAFRIEIRFLPVILQNTMPSNKLVQIQLIQIKVIVYKIVSADSTALSFITFLAWSLYISSSLYIPSSCSHFPTPKASYPKVGNWLVILQLIFYFHSRQGFVGVGFCNSYIPSIVQITVFPYLIMRL